MEPKPVGEVMAANKRVAAVLEATRKSFPKREESEGWEIQKYHGCFRMATIQQLRHGHGEGWDGSHVEQMHKTVFTELEKKHSTPRTCFGSTGRST